MTTSMNIRVEPEIKKQAQELFAALGMDMTTAVNIFLRQAISKNGLPFMVKLGNPNRETLEAMAEVEEMKKNPDNCQGYRDANEMLRDILS